MATIVDALLGEAEPALVWLTRAHVLGEDKDSRAMRRLRDTIRSGRLATGLLTGRDASGRIAHRHPYAKWQGAHWVLAALADVGYPPGDDSLVPLRDQVQDIWLDESFFREFVTTTRPLSFGDKGVPVIDGRYRRCGSQQGNALRAVVALGIADGRTGQLAERLRHWQWPDGGWNCDKDPAAAVSSFNETLLPMRGLASYGRFAQDKPAQDAADRAAEVFLGRELLYRKRNGQMIRPEFGKLHYPLYWHYDVLGGLVGLRECGRLADPRCARALEVLLAKRLPDGGWPVEAVYYKVSATGSNTEAVSWGGTSTKRFQPWTTVGALAVLVAAGIPID